MIKYIITQKNPTSDRDILACAKDDKELAQFKEELKDDIDARDSGEDYEVYLLVKQ
jgi:hypothetical protein